MDLDRFEWLALRQEDAIDPTRPIVDPHLHLWDRGGSTYLAPQLLDDTTATHNVVKTIYVECIASYDKSRERPFWPVGETVFVAAQADETDAAGGPTIAGIVGHADMMLGEGIQDVLAAHVAASGGRFRGIRHMTAWDQSDDVENAFNRPFEHMMETPEFRAAARSLASMELSFDAWVFHPQLSEVAALAQSVPNLSVVVNHLGAPLGIGPYGNARDQVRSDWKAGMECVAQRPNVRLKIGGIGMDDKYDMGWVSRDAPPTSEEVAEYWTDDVRYCIELFGPDRCMFESNFPVDRQTLPYPVIWNAFQIMADGYTGNEQHELFYGTATRTYGLL